MFIILASTSKYRKQLLEAAGIHAECVAPEYDEKPIDGMHPLEQIAEFARGKASSVAAKYPNSIIIASDQGLFNGSELVGKPGTFENACKQLEITNTCHKCRCIVQRYTARRTEPCGFAFSQRYE